MQGMPKLMEHGLHVVDALQSRLPAGRRFGHIADIDNGNSIDRNKKSNTLCFAANVNGKEELVHNMYSSKGVFWKSAIYKTSKTARTDTTHDF